VRGEPVGYIHHTKSRSRCGASLVVGARRKSPT
jgi:hypothetical protein